MANIKDIPQEILTQIAEIIRRVGKRSEIEDEVAEKIDLGELTAALVEEAGPVRDAATKMIAEYLKDFDISGTDISSDVLNNIDVKKLTPQLLQSEKFNEAFIEAVNTALTDGDFDMSGLLEEVLTEENFNKIMTNEDSQKALAKKVAAYVEDINLFDLDQSIIDNLDAELFTSEVFAQCAKNKDVVKAIEEKVEEYIGDILENEDNPISTAIASNRAFQQEIDKAIKAVLDSERIEHLVEKAVTALLNDDEEILRNKLIESISGQLVNRLATNMVAQVIKM